MSDLIDRQAAIEGLKEYIDDTGIFNQDKWFVHGIKTAITHLKTLPSVQPELCEDAVSREAVSEWLKQYGQDVLHGKYKFSLMYIWKNLMDLPFVQPDIIHCKDCRYFKSTTSIHGECECGEMWQSLFGETTEVEAINVHKDHYCGYAERKTDEYIN